jgi:hypothetical protein
MRGLKEGKGRATEKRTVSAFYALHDLRAQKEALSEEKVYVVEQCSALTPAQKPVFMAAETDWREISISLIDPVE